MAKPKPEPAESSSFSVDGVDDDGSAAAQTPLPDVQPGDAVYYADGTQHTPTLGDELSDGDRDNAAVDTKPKPATPKRKAVTKPNTTPSPKKARAAKAKPEPASGSGSGSDTGTPAAASSSSSSSRKWTGAEYAALFAHVCTVGASSRIFEGAIPRRSRTQAYDCWRQNVRDYVLDAAARKATEGRQGPRSWTAAEYQALCTHVFAHGPAAGGFKDVVPGRSQSQCFDAWRQVLRPYLVKEIEKKPLQKGGK